MRRRRRPTPPPGATLLTFGAVTRVGIKGGPTRGDPMTIHLTRLPDPAGRSVRCRDAKELNISFCRQRYRALVRPTVKVLARVHLGLLRVSPGSLGHRLFGSRVVLLTTIGRTSGREWTTPLA